MDLYLIQPALKLALKYATPTDYERVYQTIRAALAELEQATAGKPAQRCNCCGYLVTDSEHRCCLRAAKQEPAQAVPQHVIEASNRIPQNIIETPQAVPVFWASENILKESLRDNISCILTTTKCAANTVPLYTAPPAIDDETKRMVMELCRNVMQNVASWSLADDAEAILEKLGEGNGN